MPAEGSAAGLRAAIVAIGNELLYGETVDTNSAWLGRTLAARGIPVVRRFTVGDVADDIDQALRLAMDAAGLVVMTGGLGPTPDDLTKSVVARRFGRDLVVDQGVLARLRRHFEASGYEDIPALSRGQAEVPEGSIVLENPKGTAPGIWLEVEGTHVVLLPGVPHELEAIVTGALEPHLAGLIGRAGAPRTYHRLVHTTGLAETKLAERLEPKLAALSDGLKAGVDLAYLPDVRGVDLRFTVRGGSASQADRRFDALVSALDDVLGPWRFEAESGDLAEAVIVALRRRGAALAVAESCTGGLVGKRLTDRPGSSHIFVGGVIAYDNRVKIEHLGVSPADLEREGAVSGVVARQLAEGASRRFNTAAGLGVTGVAGPGGGSKEKPVGTVWIGTSLDGVSESTLHRFAGDRVAVRERAAQAALAALYRRLTGVRDGG